jgi:AcrR family transcriptional regulator
MPIFNAAMKVFAEKGFARATVNEIAKHAGIAKGTIYNNYKSKKKLFLALLEEGIDRLEAAVSREVARKDTILDKLEALISAQLSFFEEYRDYCKVLLSEVWGLGHRWEEQVQRLQLGYFQTIQELLEKGQAEGVICRDLETETTAAAIFGAVGVAALNRFVFAREYKYNRILQTLKQFLLNGVAK